ncbi:hypothetical protein SAMN05428947_102272 [Mucilaginibacter sp. OK283]|nr:hypothetical protein SAMN05428947_102272 [Mucilaginibacter sp. OK283]
MFYVSRLLRFSKVRRTPDFYHDFINYFYMKIILLKSLWIVCIVFIAHMAVAQEYYDGTNTPRQYYYNSLESATAGTVSTFLPAAGSTRNSSSATIDLVSSSSLNSSKSLSSLALGAVGYIRWNFMSSSGSAAALSMSTRTYEWEFDYKNVTGAATADNSVTMAASSSSATDSWRYWLIANTYTANSATDYTKGLYVTQYNGNLVLRFKYGTANNQVTNYATVSMPNSSTTTYQVRIVKSVIGYYYIYILNRSTGVTTTSGPTNVGTTVSSIDLNTYNFSYLESSTSAANRFQWDNFNFYQQKVEYIPITSTANGISSTISPGQVNVIPYGVNANIRGDINFGMLRFNSTTNGQLLFSSGALFKTTNSVLSAATGTSLVTGVSMNSTNTSQMTLPTSEYYYSAGNTDGTTVNVINYFLVAQALSTFSSSAPTSIAYSVSTAAADNFQSFYTSGFFPYNGASTTGATVGVVKTYDWTGSTSTDWNNTGNWSSSTVPTSIDIARIGVVTLSGSKFYPIIPVSSVATSVGSIIFGTDNSQYTTFAVNTSFTVNGDITVTASLGVNSTNGSTYSLTLSGTGSLTVTGALNIGDYSTPKANNTPFSFTTSIPQMTMTGNINLISTLDNGQRNFDAKISIISGTVSASSITSSNQIAQNLTQVDNTSTVSVSGTGTLKLIGSSALSALSSLGTNVMSFNNAGATVEYAGANQTIYTTATITGASGSGTGNLANGVSYYNLKTSGSGIKTVLGSTLSVSGDFTTSNAGVDLAANDPTVNVTGNWTNSTTVTQDSGPITIGGNVTNNSGGTLALGSGNLSIAGNYTNNSGGVYSQSTGTTYFNGSAAQSLSDLSSAGTVFSNVNFSGTSLSNAKTMSGSGGFAVAGTGTLTMANATTKLDAGGVLTLMSNASSTATVAQIPTGAVITGNVNAQRYLTGGAGFRGYRLMSPPVNISSNTSGAGNIGLSYISTSQTFGGVTYRGALTGGQGTGFFVFNGNPSLYLYNEALTTNNSNSYVSGKNVGVYDITATGVTTSSGYPAVLTTGVTIPVGNSFLFFFIGDNSSTQTASAVRTPENTTITAIGYLNQGNVPVKFWNTNSTSIPYHTGTGAILPGYNQVGNPYASTISLDVFYADNLLTPSLISPIFWEMSQPAQTYISYNALTHTTSNTKASKYIVSGQGFIIDATATGQTATFKEDQKVSYPAITKSTTPALLMSTKNDIRMLKKSFSTPAQENTPAGMHLQLTKDSMVNTQCGIYFAKEWDDKFHNTEDALDLDGASPKVYLSSYSADGVRTSINQLADYKETGKKVKLFVRATASGLYNLDLVDINTDTVQYKFYLIDHFKKDSLDIGRYKSYAFNIVTADTATFGGNRFELSVQQQPASKYQLVTFTAQKATDGVLVTWRTYNEGSNYFFTVEKQEADGSGYAPVYQVQSNGGTIYKYTDKLPNTGNNVYRLKQVDLFGNISYSNPVSIYFDKNGNADMFSVYPNPTAGTLNVNVTNGKITTVPTAYKLNIYDITGALVVQKTSVKDSWSENVSQFIPGVYIVELKDAGGNSLGKAKFVKK